MQTALRASRRSLLGVGFGGRFGRDPGKAPAHLGMLGGLVGEHDLPAAARPAEAGEEDRILDDGSDLLRGQNPAVGIGRGENQMAAPVAEELNVWMKVEADGDSVAAVVSAGSPPARKIRSMPVISLPSSRSVISRSW